MVPSPGVQLPQRRSWLSTQRVLVGLGEAKLARQSPSPLVQVQAGRVLAPADAPHHLVYPPLFLGPAHRGRHAHPDHVADLASLDRFVPASAPDYLDLHNASDRLGVACDCFGAQRQQVDPLQRDEVEVLMWAPYVQPPPAQVGVTAALGRNAERLFQRDHNASMRHDNTGFGSADRPGGAALPTERRKKSSPGSPPGTVPS